MSLNIESGSGVVSRNTLIEDCIQYLLIAHQTKFVIEHSEIIKHALRGNGYEATEIIEECVLILKNVYGYKLVAIPNKQQYILVNNIKVDDSQLVHRTPESYQTIGILLPVLAVIFMMNDEMKEDEMWKFLAKLGFDVEVETPIEGLDVSIRELLTNRWTRQLYLEHEKIPMSNQEEYVFRWGFRAFQEVDRMNIMKFVCENYDLRFAE